MALKTDILKQLKNRIIQLPNDITESNFIKENKSNSSYYVRPSYLNNLYLNKEDFDQYKQFFEVANGKELLNKKQWGNICKMQSLGSSSAMIVNLIGTKKNNLLEIKKNQFGIPSGRYYVSFERKLRTLNTENSEKCPAHVDGFLLSKNKENIILIESKMLEYLVNEPKTVSATYLDSKNYFSNGDAFVSSFIKASKMFKNLDYPQLIKHVLGFYNAKNHPYECFYNYKLNTEDLSLIKNVYLLNVVWHICDKSNPIYPEYERYWLNEKPNTSDILEVEKMLNSISSNSFNLKEFPSFWFKAEFFLFSFIPISFPKNCKVEFEILN